MKFNTNKMMTTSMSNPLVIVVSLLIILIVVLAVFRSVAPVLNLGFEVSAHIGDLRGSFEIEAFDNSNDSSPVFAMYYANWCGHCKKAKPEFQKAMNDYNGSIKMMMVDCEDPQNKELAQSQQIKGFPTIRLYKSGLSSEYQEYSGERTYSNFIQYLNSVSGTLDVAPNNAAPVM